MTKFRLLEEKQIDKEPEVFFYLERRGCGDISLVVKDDTIPHKVNTVLSITPKGKIFLHSGISPWTGLNLDSSNWNKVVIK